MYFYPCNLLILSIPLLLLFLLLFFLSRLLCVLSELCVEIFFSPLRGAGIYFREAAFCLRRSSMISSAIFCGTLL